MAKKKPLIYKSCETLPIYNFKKMSTDDNLMWLIRCYDGDEDVKVEENLDDLRSKIIREYINLSNDTSLKLKFRDKIYIKRLEDKLKCCTYIINILEENKKDILIYHIQALSKVLEKFSKRYRINIKKDLDDEIKRLRKSMLGLKLKIDIKTQELGEKTENKEETSIYDDVIRLEKALDSKYRIDPKKTSVALWISYVNNSKKWQTNLK